MKDIFRQGIASFWGMGDLTLKVQTSFKSNHGGLIGLSWHADIYREETCHDFPDYLLFSRTQVGTRTKNQRELM